MSPIYCPIHETTPGPTMFDGKELKKGRLLYRAMGNEAECRQGKLTLGVIREHLRKIVGQRAQGDANIYYLDGAELYGAADNARLPLLDELHPDSETQRLIGERFHELVFSGGVFDNGGA